MPAIDAFAAELDQEAATTRRLLERMPDERVAWRPHERSMTLGRLCGHIAELPGWGTVVLQTDEFDFARSREQGFEAFSAPDRASLLQRYDEGVRQLRAAAEGISDTHLAGSWTLRAGDHVVFTAPRKVALRTFVLSHIVHHRGQLSVFLRLLDVPVPAVYGPSADEGQLAPPPQ